MKRVKMEVDDGHGGKYTFTFNGSMNNNQLSKFNQIIDLMKDEPINHDLEIPQGNLSLIHI